MTAHALLSASGASRWLACTPSARLEENFPDTTSDFAKEGTLAHEVCELKLRRYAIEPMSTRTFNARYKKLKADPLWQNEMDEHTETYLDYIKQIMLQYPVQPAVVAEKQVDFSRYVPGGFGTADCLILAGEVLHVIDFKYGKGVEVSAVDNPQMMLYALGALEAYGMLYCFSEIRLAIVQPRIGNISEWTISAGALMLWGTEKVKPAAQLAYNGEGEYKPGDHCRFCRAKKQCQARADACMSLLPEAQKLQEAKGAQKDIPGLYSPEELSKYIKAGALIKSWYEDICEHALSLCLNGEDVPGYKAVEGRRVRSFTDQEAAFDALRTAGYDDAVLYNRVPLTLSAAEKLVGKKRFGELAGSFITQKPGKPTLVSESDKRDRITNKISAADVFDKMEE